MKRDAVYAAVELAWLTVLFIGGVWGPYFAGVNGWTIAACVLFFVTVITSAVLRKHDWKKSGLRLDNLTSGWSGLVLLLAGALLASLLVAQFIGAPLARVSGKTLFDRLASGIAQEVLFLGYFFHRWRALLHTPLRAAAANALWFGLIHVPDPALVALATFGGFFFNWLFIRMGNVYVIGLAHGVLSMVLLPLLTNYGVMTTARIGPPALEPLARQIVRDWRPGDRVGICSFVLAPDQFGFRFNVNVERFLRGSREEATIRQRLIAFFTGAEKVYCVTTEREFQRFIDPALSGNVHRLADWFIWRDIRSMSPLFDGGSVVDIFRDRAILVSNRPPQ
jgi:hypothetical protein